MDIKRNILFMAETTDLKSLNTQLQIKFFNNEIKKKVGCKPGFVLYTLPLQNIIQNRK